MLRYINIAMRYGRKACCTGMDRTKAPVPAKQFGCRARPGVEKSPVYLSGRFPITKQTLNSYLVSAWLQRWIETAPQATAQFQSGPDIPVAAHHRIPASIHPESVLPAA